MNEKSILNLELIGLVLGLAVQAGIAVWWASGIQSKMYHLEHEITKMHMNVDQNTEFRILWPRGEMGALPDDVKQDSAIEILKSEVARLRARSESKCSN
jgi:hypothetical protein